MKIEKADEIVRILWKRGKLNNVKFEWSERLHRGLGYYQIKRGLNKKISRKIVMSKPIILLNSKKVFIDALLHEIAHHIAGYTNGHNHVWKTVAKQIGCTANHYYKSSLKTPKGKYIYQCPKCKYLYHFYRKTTSKVSCGMCCDKYNNKKFSNKFILVSKPKGL